MLDELESNLLWCSGRGDDLVVEGKLGGESDITPSGRVAYGELLRSGFRPNAILVRSILREQCDSDAECEQLCRLFLS